jgi:hypothetical protein
MKKTIYSLMKHIKQYNQFVNEEEGLFKNLLLSTMLSLGINSVDAQTIQQDSVKTEIVKDIGDFNKGVILNLNDDSQVLYDKLKKDLLRKNINEPDTFIKQYLKLQSDGTLIVRPKFVEGLELHLNRSTNTFEVGYNFKF